MKPLLSYQPLQGSDHNSYIAIIANMAYIVNVARSFRIPIEEPRSYGQTCLLHSTVTFCTPGRPTVPSSTSTTEQCHNASFAQLLSLLNSFEFLNISQHSEEGPQLCSVQIECFALT